MPDTAAIYTDILHFSARVLVGQSARVVTGSESDPEHRFADLLPRRAIPGVPASPRAALAREGPIGPVVGTAVSIPRSRGRVD